MGFNDKQIQELKKPLDPKLVKGRPDNNMSYIEGWQAENVANEIFNFDWSSEVVELIENTTPTLNQNKNNVVSFRAKVRVTACGVVKEGVGFGSGIKKDIHAAYEDAIKEAETDAEKRALKKFGHRFGLALYDKEQANVRDVEAYEMDTRRLEVAKTGIIADLQRSLSIKALSENWKLLAKDINEVKRHNKDWYNEIMNTYAELKTRLQNENT